MQRLVIQKLRNLLDMVLDKKPGAILDRLPIEARREIRASMVSFIQSDEVCEALLDLWRRWLGALSHQKLDPWLPRLDTRALRVRTLLQHLDKVSQNEERIWRCRQALVAEIESLAASSPKIGQRLRYLRRVLTDEAYTVVVRCDHEVWRKWLQSQPEYFLDKLAAIEHIPGKKNSEYGDGFEIGGPGGPLELHGALQALEACGERVQIVHEASSPYENTDLTATCELLVIIDSSADETPRRYEHDGNGLVRQVTLRTLDDLPREIMIAVASWDRARELERIVHGLEDIARSGSLSEQATQGLKDVIDICRKVVHAESIGPIPSVELGALGNIVSSVQSFLSGERSRSMLAALLREVIDRVMDIPIGFPAERLGELTIRWIEEKVPVWIYGLIQRHAHRLAGALDFRDTARRAIEETDVAEVEKIIKSELAGPAFLWLEALGGALGFAIGLVLHLALPVFRSLIHVAGA